MVQKCAGTPRLENCAGTLILTNCAGTPRLENYAGTPMLTNCSIIFEKCAGTPRLEIVLVPHANKLLQKFVLFNKAINLHSRAPTDQHFYVWEPHRGCLHKVKNVCWCPFIREGQQRHKYAFQMANRAIKLKSVLVPPCSILLSSY